MRVFLQKRGDGLLAPACETSEALVARLATGEAIEADWKTRNTRSVQWHRRYFALCNLIYQNCEEFRSVEDVHLQLKARAGLYDSLITLPNGTQAMLVRSIAFDNMTADEWAQAWPRLLDVVHQEILPGIELPEVEDEIARLAA